jgi:flagellar protein FliS
MWNNEHNTYMESRILGADPLELVNLLYQGCRQSVRDAREHLAAGRIAERSRAITQACEILVELAQSLNHSETGEISRRLAALYDYMQHRLLEANIRQTDEPLAEVLGLLTTLGEAWDDITRAAAQPVAQCGSPWTQPSASAAHAWSF